MAKVVKNLITEGLSGSVSDSDYAFRRVYGETYLVRKPEQSDAPPTEQQEKVRALFTQAQAEARDILQDAQQRLEWQKKAKASKKYKTAYGACFAHVYEELKKVSG